MQRKIKKLSISAEKGGLICFRPGDLTRQKITIKNNGQVWWTGFRTPTEEEIAKGILQYNQVKISGYKNRKHIVFAPNLPTIAIINFKKLGFNIVADVKSLIKTIKE